MSVDPISQPEKSPVRQLAAGFGVSVASDMDLLGDYVRRDSQAAFEELVSRYQGMVYASAYRVCANRSDAQDVLQHAFSVLAKKAGTLGEVRSLGGWLHRVTTWEAVKVKSRNQSRKRSEVRAVREREIEYDGETLAQKVSPFIDELLESLRCREREIVVLHYFEGLTFRCIGERLGSTSESVRKCCSRALDKLAARLGSKGVTLSSAALASFLADISQGAQMVAEGAAVSRIAAEAMAQGAGKASFLGGITSLIITMKTGIIVSIASGVLLSAGWAYFQTESSGSGEVFSGRESLGRTLSRSAVRAGEAVRVGFSMELVEHAVNQYDNAYKEDPYVESRLRSLMFSVPREHLSDVYGLLSGVKNKPRFQQAAASLFARWAELDPEQALEKSSEAGDYVWQARRGVLVTWLSKDYRVAIDAIVRSRLMTDFRHINQYLKFRVQSDPGRASEVVDYLAEQWPGSEKRTLRYVAQMWSNIDPQAACDWVGGLPSGQFRQKTLHYLAGTTAKVNGMYGLAMADQIENPSARAAARNHAIYWWGTTAGGASVKPGRLAKHRDISSGFPDDWTDQNIHTFAKTSMYNFSRDLSRIAAIAKNSHQKELVYRGAIDGAAYSKPADAIHAVAAVSDSYVRSAKGQRALKVYFRRWVETDPVSFNDWVFKQSDGVRKRLALEEMKRVRP